MNATVRPWAASIPAAPPRPCRGSPARRARPGRAGRARRARRCRRPSRRRRRRPRAPTPASSASASRATVDRDAPRLSGRRGRRREPMRTGRRRAVGRRRLSESASQRTSTPVGADAHEAGDAETPISLRHEQPGQRRRREQRRDATRRRRRRPAGRGDRRTPPAPHPPHVGVVAEGDRPVEQPRQTAGVPPRHVSAATTGQVERRPASAGARQQCRRRRR